MRGATLVGLLVLMLVPLTAAHIGHGGPQTVIVTAHDAETPNGTLGWFAVDNRTEPNPTLGIEPGQRLFVHFVNAGSANHTLELGEPVERSLGPVSPANETSASIEVPEETSGSVVYRDPAWADRGMLGQLAVHGSETTRSAPGLTAPVAGLVLLLVGLRSV